MARKKKGITLGGSQQRFGNVVELAVYCDWALAAGEQDTFNQKVLPALMRFHKDCQQLSGKAFGMNIAIKKTPVK